MSKATAADAVRAEAGTDRTPLDRDAGALAREARAPARSSVEREVLESLAGTGFVPDQPAFGAPAGAPELAAVRDARARPLSAALPGPVGLERALALGVAASRALSSLHEAGFAHCNLRPECLLELGESVQLTGLGLAVRATWQQPAAVDRDAWRAAAGEPVYASPELCGRVNVRVDERSDLYSLGAVLYELLLGRPPFADVGDALVHAHVAREAPALFEASGGAVPRCVSRVVAKLLAKAPAERYQTARGVEYDLAHLPAERAELGSHDALDRFAEVRRLYGRETEVRQLLELHAVAAAEGSEGAQFALVAGYSGVGKSSLVAEALRRVARPGLHATGKFEQLQRTVPYSAVAQAVSALLRQLLRGSQARLDQWRAELLAAEAQVLVDVAPELRAVLGEGAPAVEALPPDEAKARFERVFVRFLATMGRPGAPLVLLLDDLQWADAASLSLVGRLLRAADVRNVLVVGAYRDNELEGPVPEPQLRLALRPLSRASVEELVRDLLRAPDASAVAPLVAAVYDKTEGNPFFVRQFLSAARDNGLLWFDHEGERWRFDPAGVARMGGDTASVVELVAAKIRTLPPDTQRALQTAACIGARFRCRSRDDEQHLQPAIAAQLVVVEGAPEEAPDGMRFQHDRVQQAAYETTPVEERPALHLRVARLLLTTLRDDSPAQEVCAVADHFNVGLGAGEQDAEAAELNVRASERAEASMAHAAALAYAQSAKRLAGAAPWPALFTRLMVSQMLNGHFEESAACVREALAAFPEARADAVPFLQHLIVLHTVRGDYGAGIATARRALELLDVHVPAADPEDVEAALDAELAAVEAQLPSASSVRELRDRPEMTDQRWRTAVDLLQTMGPPCYVGDQLLWGLVVAKSVAICLEHGNVPSAVYSYAALGALLASRRSNFALGDDLASLALALADHYASALVCVGRLTIGCCLRHWCPATGSIRRGAADFLEGYEAGVRANNMQFAGYCFGNYAHHVFFGGGVPLPRLRRLAAEYLQFCRDKQNSWGVEVLEGVALVLGDLDEDDAAYCERALAAKSFQTLAIYRTVRARALLLRAAAAADDDDVSDARALTALVEADLGYIAPAGLLVSAEHVVNCALVAARLGLRAELEAAVAQLRVWGAASPGSFGARLALAEAELLALRAKEECWPALLRFLAAAELATEGEECPPVAILAHQGAARLCRAQPALALYASAHEAEARRLQAQWGGGGGGGEEEPTTTTTTTTTTRVPDVNADVLMPVLLQATGADRGLLLQRQDDDDVWRVRARASVAVGGGEDVRVEAVTQATAPMSLVREASRLRTAVVVGDARAADSPYAADPYWKGGGPRAVLSLPLAAAGGGPRTVVLLENSLTPNAFSDDSVRAARALAQQVAVSMGLYSQYEDVYERTEAGLLRVLPSGGILSANPAARRLLGPGADELVFAEAAGRDAWMERVRSAEDGSLSDVEAQIVGAGGESVWVSIRTSALRDPHGGVRVLEVALQDISVAKERAELELQRQAAKSKFLSVVAHEVRTPMNAIMCTTEVALASATDEAHLETLRAIRVAGHQLLSLLNEVLDHNKAEEGKLDLVAEPFELRRVVGDIMGIVECNVLDSSVKLRAEVADDVPDAVVGDSKRLGQCLLNLLSNAVKFTSEGEVVLAVSLEAAPCALRVEVRDSGVGIAPDQLERVFEPYVQAAPSTWRDHGGTGLGLSIVRQIVSLMGGQIGVESAGLGCGSVFWFSVSLPLSSAEALADHERADLAAQRLLPLEARAGVRVLIVDDSRMNCKVAAMLCKSLGFTLTETAANGREAVERLSALRSPPVDAVLMDLHMPVLDGAEATRELRAAGSTLPIVGVTAASAEADIERCKAAGMDGVVVKPLDRARLEAALVSSLLPPHSTC